MCSAAGSHPLRDGHQRDKSLAATAASHGFGYPVEVGRISGKTWPYSAERASRALPVFPCRSASTSCRSCQSSKSAFSSVRLISSIAGHLSYGVGQVRSTRSRAHGWAGFPKALGWPAGHSQTGRARPPRAAVRWWSGKQETALVLQGWARSWAGCGRGRSLGARGKWEPALKERRGANGRVYAGRWVGKPPTWGGFGRRKKCCVF